MVRQIFKDIKDEGTELFKDLKRGVGDAFKDVKEDVTDGFGAAKDFIKRFKFVEDRTPDIFFPEFYQDECNTVILFNPGIHESNVRIVYRHPNCRLPKPPTRPNTDYSEYADIPESEYDSDLYLIIPDYTYNYFSYDIPNSYDKTTVTFDYQGFEGIIGESPIKVTVGVKVRVEYTGLNIHRRAGSTFDQATIDSFLDRGGTITGDPFKDDSYWILEVKYTAYSFWNGYGSTYYDYSENKGFFHGTVQFIGARYSEFIVDPHRPANIRTSSFYSDGILSSVHENRVKVIPIHEIVHPFIPPPPPPPMSCCPNVQENDQLLRLILKRIGEPKEVIIFDEDLARKGAQKAKRKPQSLNDYLKLAVERTEIISRIVGIENFPITVPDTMIEPHKEGVFAKMFGFIDGKKKRKINTIAELITWMSEQDSAVLGQFHQVIEFETGGKDKKGKAQKSTVVLPNVAETLKEIILLTSQMAFQNNVQTELIFKIASEVVAARAAAHKSALIAADIQDYLDYPTETKSCEIATTVNFPRISQNKKGQFQVTSANEDYKEFLKAGKVKFSYDDWTGDTSLRDQLMDLLQVASALRASMMQRIDE